MMRRVVREDHIGPYVTVSNRKYRPTGGKGDARDRAFVFAKAYLRVRTSRVYGMMAELMHIEEDWPNAVYWPITRDRDGFTPAPEAAPMPTTEEGFRAMEREFAAEISDTLSKMEEMFGGPADPEMSHILSGVRRVHEEKRAALETPPLFRDTE